VALGESAESKRVNDRGTLRSWHSTGPTGHSFE
jgi:hypothetical protein